MNFYSLARVSIDAYFINNMSLQGCHSLPIGRLHTFPSVLIDNYCSIEYVCKVGSVSASTYSINHVCKCVDRHRYIARLNGSPKVYRYVCLIRIRL